MCPTILNLTQKDEQLLASSHGKGCTVFPTSIESIPSQRKTSIRVPDAVKRHSMRAYNVQSMLAKCLRQENNVIHALFKNIIEKKLVSWKVSLTRSILKFQML